MEGEGRKNACAFHTCLMLTIAGEPSPERLGVKRSVSFACRCALSLVFLVAGTSLAGIMTGHVLLLASDTEILRCTSQLKVFELLF